MITSLQFDEYGRLTARVEETQAEANRHRMNGYHPTNHARQVTAGEVHFANKGKQRRPANEHRFPRTAA